MLGQRSQASLWSSHQMVPRPECQGPHGCANMAWRMEPGGYLRQILNARVYDVAIETDLQEAPRLSEELGNTILLKREDMQPVHSFKVRGAFNRLSQMTQEQLVKGVICASAGNHAQGVALAARNLGCPARICMPITASTIKVDAVRRLGGIIELVGQTYAEAQTYAQAEAKQHGLVFISAFDDPLIIAGTGTMGLEILRNCSTAQLRTLHAIFVPVGGGGMIAGIAAYVKAVNPQIKIFGVEPTGANAMAISLKQGHRVKLSSIDVFADGVAIKQPGAECFRICRELVDGILLVDNAATSAAVKDVFNETRSILEPAGAVSVAGVKAYLKARPDIKGQTMVAVTSGANINFDRLRLVAELADLGAQREAMLATTITGVPGSLKAFVDCALKVKDINFTELRHRYTAGRPCHVLWSVGVQRDQQLRDLLAQLNSTGLATKDISGIEAAQVHLRHLVGGRARGSPVSEDMQNERLYTVDIPERRGAIQQLLDVISPHWNVTLFHYRKTGARSSAVLLGLQVPVEADERFFAEVGTLAPEFNFTELKTDARQIFDMFLQ
ncbi:hypothetical protein WJX72_009564 [[Myrmecia] bisecta]|uniref:Threonine dehydratase n=1 Tax=[Myrmecia] bisecta TaxID=41462 RepID=A0AAW1PDX1_9CHLO